MSRTEKDWPYWVRATFYEPSHDWCCPDRISRSYQHYRRSGSCTLPAYPVRNDKPLSRSGSKIPDVPNCRWDPSGWDRKYYTKPPGRVDRRLYFHGPTRREVRDFCAKARQEFAGRGTVETVEPPPWRPSALDWWD